MAIYVQFSQKEIDYDIWPSKHIEINILDDVHPKWCTPKSRILASFLLSCGTPIWFCLKIGDPEIHYIHIRICIYMYVIVCIYIHTYTYIYTHTYKYMYIHVCIYIYTYIYMYIYTRILRLCICIFSYLDGDLGVPNFQTHLVFSIGVDPLGSMARVNSRPETCQATRPMRYPLVICYIAIENVHL